MTDSAAHLQDKVDRLASLLLELQLEVRDLREDNSVLVQRVSALEATVAESTFAVVKEDKPASAGGSFSTGAISSERLAISRGIGLWLQRCLAGGHRGKSGRDQVPDPSKFYLVVRDINQRVHNPPLLFDSWVEAKPWCVNRGRPGDSIFIGLPTAAEVREAVRSAGLEQPASLLLQ